jgi:rare lipoprotein A
MKSKTMMCCAFAGTILATTLSGAHATEFGAHHARHHAGKRSAALHHRHHTRHLSVVTREHDERTFAPSFDHDGRNSRAGRHAGSQSGSGQQSGIASVYSGGRTANGEVASAGRLTAAHRSLPFGTMVRVTHRGNGRSVVVRINDRGPFVRGRVIDLTPAAARAIGFSGLAPVTLSVEGHG